MHIDFESVNPADVKAWGKNFVIEYGIHSSPFGLCMIANSAKGICALEFIDDNQQLIIDRFLLKWHEATVIQNQQNTHSTLMSVFSDKQQVVKVLLSGSPFQIKVWEELIKIPGGTLVSYNYVANAIGMPSASRAAASAIGKNNIGYIIPCHRVIRSTGGMGGYKWGIERKKAIIGWEKQNS